MKKILPWLLCLLPVTSIASDSYDPDTGIVHMPTVIVGTENYGINMEHQGDLVFKVTSATPSTFTSSIFDTYDSTTGVLHMPMVDIGSNNFEVDMIHQGDLVFKVTTATQINFEFTTDYLNGKTLYNVSKEDGKWGVGTISFTDTTWEWVSIENSNDKFSTSYTITEEGYITNPSPEGGKPDYIKAVVKTDDYLNLSWVSELKYINYINNNEYFFFELQKAQDFVTTKNSE